MGVASESRNAAALRFITGLPVDGDGLGVGVPQALDVAGRPRALGPAKVEGRQLCPPRMMLAWVGVTLPWLHICHYVSI